MGWIKVVKRETVEGEIEKGRRQEGERDDPLPITKATLKCKLIDGFRARQPRIQPIVSSLFPMFACLFEFGTGEAQSPQSLTYPQLHVIFGLA